MTAEEKIRAMPKAELHRHIEGCVRVSNVIDLARKNNLKLPTFDPAGLDPFKLRPRRIAVEVLGCSSWPRPPSPLMKP